MAEAMRAARLEALRAVEVVVKERARINTFLWLKVLDDELREYLSTPPEKRDREFFSWTYALADLGEAIQDDTGSLPPYAPVPGADTDTLLSVLREHGYTAFLNTNQTELYLDIGVVGP